MFKKNTALLIAVYLTLTACGGSNSRPLAVFSVDAEPAGQMGFFLLDAGQSYDPDGELVSYEWSFGDGHGGHGVSVSHRFDETGTYTIVLTVTDDEGATSQASETVRVDSVNQPPVPVIETTETRGRAPLAVDFSGQLSVDPDGDIRAYQWTLNGQAVSGQDAFFYVFEEPGSYEVSLEVEDNQGATASDFVTVTVVDESDLFTLEGQITSVAYTDVDGDTNDPNASQFDNNGHTLGNIQAISNPVALNGFLTQSPTGQEGDRFRFETDLHDFYSVTLRQEEFVSLRIFNGEADVDLFLMEQGTLDVVASSMSSGEYESVQAPADGDYVVMLNVTTGTTKYLLRVGATSLVNGPLAKGQSGHFNPGQLIVKRKAKVPQRSLAKAQLSLSHQSHGREALAHINSLNPQTRSALQLQSSAGFHRLLESINPEAAAKLRTLSAMKTLAGQEDIEFVEPNYRVSSLLTPNDPAYGVQWHYPAMNLPQAWDITTGTDDVTVAVVDSGIYSSHLDLRGQLVDGYDFISDPALANDGDGIDPNPEDVGEEDLFGGRSWHGTHTAGIIGALMNNGEGGTGVAPGARLMPLRAIGGGEGSTYDVLQAVRYAAGMENDSGTLPSRSADIINLSLGGGGYSRASADVYRKVRARDIVVIAAAGNDNTAEPLYPASYDSVLSVAGTDFNGDRAPYSNFGPHVDIAAPGGSMSADENGDGYSDGVLSAGVFDSGALESGYVFYQGTSMAAPHVSGVVALMKSVYPALTPDQLDSLIVNGEITHDRGSPGRDDYYGYGMLDAFLAVGAARSLADGGETVALVASAHALAFNNALQNLEIRFNKLGVGAISLQEYSVTEPWLSIEPLAVDEYGIGEYRISVDRTGLSDGRYQGTVEVRSSTGQLITVQVTMRVGEVLETGNSGFLYVFLMSADDLNPIDMIGVAPLDGHYNYRFENIPPGEYSVAAGSDIDNDDIVCFIGESCGGFPSPDEYDVIPVYSDLTNINFSVGLQDSLGLTSTADSQMDVWPLYIRMASP